MMCSNVELASASFMCFNVCVCYVLCVCVCFICVCVCVICVLLLFCTLYTLYGVYVCDIRQFVCVMCVCVLYMRVTVYVYVCVFQQRTTYDYLTRSDERCLKSLRRTQATGQEVRDNH